MTGDRLPLTSTLVTLAQAQVDRRAARSGTPPVSLRRRAAARVSVDEDFCRAVADRFDQAPPVADRAALERRYAGLAAENLRQFQLILDAGLRVAPWPGPGQPYRDSRELVAAVRRTRTLHVFLTRHGHGPGPADPDHPLRRPAGIRADGEELTHNDVFRVVHDVFGHVMFGNSFGPRGEFKATFCHLAMYPPELHGLLFAEQIGQICWFFHGPHLRHPDGRLRRPGEPGYLPPPRRPYPEQKQLVYDRDTVDRFTRLFHLPPDDPGATSSEGDPARRGFTSPS